MPRLLSYARNNNTLYEIINDMDVMYLRPFVDAWIDVIQKDGTLPYPLCIGMALYGEARGEGVTGMSAVTEVIWNRFQKSKTPYIENLLFAPHQFSCFSRGDISLSKVGDLEPHEILYYCQLANNIIAELQTGVEGQFKKDTTIYCTRKALLKQLDNWIAGKKGAWNFNVLKPRGIVGKHYFFAE